MEVSPHRTRRQLLTALVVTVAGLPLAACGTTGAPAADDDADVSLVEAAIAAEERLLAYCTALSRQQSGVAATAREIVGVQRRHVAALRDSLATADPPRWRGTVAVPRDADKAAAGLLARVESARDDRRRDCQQAGSGLLARLLASMSASHAVTSASLRESA